MVQTTFTQYQIKTEPVLATPETVTESRWHQPWSEPVRQRPRLITGANPAFFYQPIPPENLTIPWYGWLSEPVRQKQGLRAPYHPFLTQDTQPVPLTKGIGWYAPLSDPVRIKPALNTALQQFEPLQVPVQPVVSRLIQWYAWLSEPVRTPPRLIAAANPYFFYEPEFPEAMDIPWFAWFTEPVRQKQGLHTELQRAWTGPERLLPTPNVTATMAATEINNDIFLGSLNVYNSATTTTSGQGAKVTIVEVQAAGGDPVSIRES